jgi:hypothetical protein
MERGGLFQSSNISHTNCKQHIPVPFSTSTDRVGEQASKIVVRRDTLARVCGWSDFWGASSRLLAWSVRPGAASTSWCSSSFRGDECCCYSSRRSFEGLHGVHHPASTCTGVWAIRFLRSVFATAHVICSSRCCVYILLFVVFPGRRVLLLFFSTIVWGTAWRTSFCIDFVRLHRTNTRDVSCEWSH